MPARRRNAPPSDDTEIGKLVADVHNKMGEGTMLLGSQMPSFTHIPFHCFILDFATLGGYPEHCGHMLYGNENCGKTTLTLKAIASGQQKYPNDWAVLVDVEKKFDPVWARRHGVNLDKIRIVRPGTGEKAVDIIEASCRAKEVFMVALDSIPGLLPFNILDKSAEDKTMAERARLVGLLCSKLQQAWIDEQQRDHRFTFLCINQYREAIGKFSPHGGTPTSLPGGRFQNYMVDTKLEIRKQEIMEDRGGFQTHIRNEHSFKFTKSKCGFSIKSGDFVMVMDDAGREDGLKTGDYDDYKTLVTYAKKLGIVTGGGTKWTLLYPHGPTNKSHPVFSNLDAMMRGIRDNQEYDLATRQLCIMIKRRQTKLPALPPDRFLLQPVTLEAGERLEALADSLYAS